MNKYVATGLKLSHKSYQLLFSSRKEDTINHLQFIDQAASDLIVEKLLLNKPLMIARFGSTELDCLTNYISVKKFSGKWISYITGDINKFWWDHEIMESMATLAGFFPANSKSLERFAELMISEMPLVDIIASWLKDEKHFSRELSQAIRINFGGLLPYNHPNPWSYALEGKTVLVVHPFEESIRTQYKQRELLFNDQRVLPKFELKTIKAVQSIAKNKTDFSNWFDALDFMKEKISNTEFDIAIIGCGGYGFPLAAHIKRMGKKAVHLGGATQVLFGIKGKRWEVDKYNKYVSEIIMNKYWIRPLPSETPAGISNVEDGCYW